MNNKLLTLLITSVMTLSAATFNVSTTPELRTALSTAATNGEDDTIILADGTYKTTDDGNGTFIYFSNEANSLTLQGSSNENVILSGGNKHQIFNSKSSIDLRSLKLKNISFIDGNNTLGEGGGIYSNSNIEIINCNFKNNVASGAGGGFYTTVKAGNGFSTLIQNSSFTYNRAGAGSGFCAIASSTSRSNIKIENSTFVNNIASGQGGGFYTNVSVLSSVSILQTEFLNNEASSGGGFYSSSPYSPLTIMNSKFKHNVVKINGGGFYFDAQGDYANITNSIFKNNFAETGSSIYYDSPINYPSKLRILNSIFIENNQINTGSSVYILSGQENSISNSIFYNNTIDVNASTDVIVELANNYLDISKVTVQNFKKNNIYNGVNLGFADEANGDYNLTVSSDLIDAGTTTISGLTLPTTDLNGNARISGGTIDIGPYEFSTTRPTINSITYTGVAKEQNQLTFSTDYTLASGRAIDTVEYDYENSGTWTSSNTHTYNTKGTYTVKVKVTDSQGEFSFTTKTVTIVELPFADMTDTQKLVKAINPAYYSQITAIIDAEKSTAHASGITTGENNVVLDPNSYGLHTQAELNIAIADTNTTATIAGIATGKAYVQSNPSEFNLVTQTEYNTAIADTNTTATASGRDKVLSSPSTYGLVSASDLNSSISEALVNGITQGKQYVQDNLAEFGLVSKSDIELTASSISGLSAGWTLVSTTLAITDLSVFDSAKIIWIYNNASTSWSAYSSDATTKQKIIDNKSVNLITTIPAGSGIWVQK